MYNNTFFDKAKPFQTDEIIDSLRGALEDVTDIITEIEKVAQSEKIERSEKNKIDSAYIRYVKRVVEAITDIKNPAISINDVIARYVKREPNFKLTQHYHYCTLPHILTMLPWAWEKDKEKSTFKAVTIGNSGLLELIDSRKIDIDLEDAEGQSLVFRAIQGKNYVLAKQLIKRGAKLIPENSKLDSPIEELVRQFVDGGLPRLGLHFGERKDLFAIMHEKGGIDEGWVEILKEHKLDHLLSARGSEIETLVKEVTEDFKVRFKPF